MPRFEASTLIERPVDEVFQFLTRAENFAIWQAGMVDNVADAEGAPEVGATGRATLKVLGASFDVRWTILEFELNHYVSIATDWGDGQGISEWICEPDDLGTRFTLTSETDDAESPSIFGKLAAPFLERVFARDLKTSAANLKRLLEA